MRSWSTFVASSISLAQTNAMVGFVAGEEITLLKLILNCLNALIDGHGSKETVSDSLVRGCSTPAVVVETALVSADVSLNRASKGVSTLEIHVCPVCKLSRAALRSDLGQ